MRWLLLATVLLLLAIPLPAAAQYPSLQAPPNVDKAPRGSVAVVVAVEDYLLLPDVGGALLTANDWETFFRQGLGVDSVRVLVNQDASREEILSFAKRASEDVREGADVWFVFVGHGAPAPSGDDGLLVGVDAQQTTSSLAARSVPQKDVLAALGAGKQARTLLVVDACFSGRTSSGAALAKGAQPVVVVSTPRVDRKTLVFSAARAQEFAGALPGKPRPAFSYLLLGAMRGWADDGDGVVTAQEALDWVRLRLRGMAGRVQTPQLHGESSFTLTRGATAADPGIDRLMSSAGAAPRPTGKQIVEEVPDGECSGGQVRTDDTAGHCCWPGQAWNGAECVGIPSKCPEGAQVSSKAEACIYPECDTGKVRMRDGIHCCWPRQAYSSAQNMCIGAPACPPDTVADGQSCAADRDSDGLADNADTCVDQPEDFDGVSDEDGCPEDNDGDGVADADDKCPDQPEDDDGFESDGCPDDDNDGDQIADASDQCPDEPEDSDGVSDYDGCPEDDGDRDGIADADDQCQEVGEEVDGVADLDGCPEAGNGSVARAYIVGGIGLGMLGFPAVPFFKAIGLRSRTRAQIADGELTQREVVTNQESANNSMLLATLLAIPAGLMFTTGVIIWFADADSPIRSGPEVSVWTLPGHGSGVALDWRW